MVKGSQYRETLIIAFLSMLWVSFALQGKWQTGIARLRKSDIGLAEMVKKPMSGFGA